MYVRFGFRDSRGCTVLYKTLPTKKTTEERRACVSDLKQQWRDTNSMKVVPAFFIEQLDAAIAVKVKSQK